MRRSPRRVAAAQHKIPTQLDCERWAQLHAAFARSFAASLGGECPCLVPGLQDGSWIGRQLDWQAPDQDRRAACA